MAELRIRNLNDDLHRVLRHLGGAEGCKGPGGPFTAVSGIAGRFAAPPGRFNAGRLSAEEAFNDPQQAVEASASC